VADSTGSGLAAFLQSHLRPGMTVLDVGANIGGVTAAAAEIVGADGRVFAYEPGAAAVQTLRERCVRWSHVNIRHTAVSDACGHMFFFVDAGKSTSATLFADLTGEGHERVLVPVCSLDSELAGLPPVDFIKIDAQGAEGRILEGARRLLKRDKPLVIFELWPSGLKAARTDAEHMLQRMAGLGYHFHPINGKGAIGSDLRVRALLDGVLRSSAVNVLAHPRRWPSRRWAAVPAPCLLPRERRELCRPWVAQPAGSIGAVKSP